MAVVKISRRLVLPSLGVAVFLLAYLAQNVWQIFHIDDVTRAIRSFDQAGMVIGMAVLGLVEASIVVCFYIPGTAVVIVLLLGMQPGWAEALPLMISLMAGTMAGYGLSLVLGRLLHRRLPSLVGDAYFRRGQRLIERYGLVSFIPGAIHPNQLALGFAILGYFRTEGVWRYFVVAAASQSVWWSLYASAADLIARQDLISRSNFQLYVAALFALWFLYELLLSKPQT